MTRASSSIRPFFHWASIALALALTNCGGADGETASNSTPRNTGGKSGGTSGKSGNGSGGSGSTGSGSNGSGSNGSGSSNAGGTGSGSNGSGGSGGGVDLGGGSGGGAVDCSRKDGKVDQQGCSCEIGKTQACFAGDVKLAGVGLCNLGTQTCVPAKKNQGEVGPDSVWGPCTGYGVPKPEICDEVDQNCNGDTKEACACQTGQTESCTTGDGFNGQRTCIDNVWSPCTSTDPPPPVCAPGATEGCVTADGKVGTKTCKPDGTWGGCGSDTTTTCVASGPEICDGKDNDCDGKIDGIIDKDGCASECLNSTGQRVCMDGKFSACVCDCTPQACSTICGEGIKICVDGQLSECQVPPVDQTCICPDGSFGTATCENGQVGACNGCSNGSSGSGGSGGGTGSLECQDCIANECSYEKISAASEQLGNDTSQCKPWYDKFIECIKNTPGSNFFNGPCDQAIGGCDFDCGCGNIIRLAADCASTGNAVGVGQVAKPGGCSVECQ